MPRLVSYRQRQMQREMAERRHALKMALLSLPALVGGLAGVLALVVAGALYIGN